MLCLAHLMLCWQNLPPCKHGLVGPELTPCSTLSGVMMGAGTTTERPHVSSFMYTGPSHPHGSSQTGSSSQSIPP